MASINDLSGFMLDFSVTVGTITPLGPLITSYTPPKDCYTPGEGATNTFGCNTALRASCCYPNYRPSGYFTASACPVGYSSRRPSYVGPESSDGTVTHEITMSIEGGKGVICCPDLRGWMDYGFASDLFGVPSITDEFATDIYCDYYSTTTTSTELLPRQLALPIMINQVVAGAGDIPRNDLTTENNIPAPPTAPSLPGASVSNNFPTISSIRPTPTPTPTPTEVAPSSTSTSISPTPTETSPISTSAKLKSGPSTPAIVGIVLGIGALFLLLIAYAAYRFGKWRDKRMEQITRGGIDDSRSEIDDESSRLSTRCIGLGRHGYDPPGEENVNTNANVNVESVGRKTLTIPSRLEIRLKYSSGSKVGM